MGLLRKFLGLEEHKSAYSVWKSTEYFYEEEKAIAFKEDKKKRGFHIRFAYPISGDIFGVQWASSKKDLGEPRYPFTKDNVLEEC